MHPNDGRVVSKYNEDITIYGDGSQTRSFCYVDDFIDGMVKMMNSIIEFTGPVNIWNPDEFSILELAEKVIDMTNSKSKIIYNSLPEDDPRQRQPLIDLAKKELDWEPRIKLEEGLVKTISYFDKLLNSNNE